MRKYKRVRREYNSYKEMMRGRRYWSSKGYNCDKSWFIRGNKYCFYCGKWYY